MHDNECVFSQHNVEDISHVLLFCPEIESWWRHYLPILEDSVIVMHYPSFCEVVECIMNSRGDENLTRFFTIAWDFWDRRNKMVYNHINLHPHFAAENALALTFLHKEGSSVTT